MGKKILGWFAGLAAVVAVFRTIFFFGKLFGTIGTLETILMYLGFNDSVELFNNFVDNTFWSIVELIVDASQKVQVYFLG